MNDNIKSLFPGEKKSDSQDFFSTFETSDARLDLRWEDGFRCSLPYIHLHEVRLTPADSDGTEEILLHYPALSVVRIVGRKLMVIYDALNNQRVGWIREKGESEEYSLGDVYVDKLEYTSLTDWRVDIQVLNERAALLQE